MTTENANKPAYPSEYEGGAKDFTGAPVIVHQKFWGLTKQEYFTAMAMQGLLSNPVYHNPNGKHKMVTVPSLAKTAIDYADETLKQLSEVQKEEQK